MIGGESSQYIQSRKSTLRQFLFGPKKGHYGFQVCGSSNANVHTPIWATDMLLCLKLPQGP